MVVILHLSLLNGRLHPHVSPSLPPRLFICLCLLVYRPLPPTACWAKITDVLLLSHFALGYFAYYKIVHEAKTDGPRIRHPRGEPS